MIIIGIVILLAFESFFSTLCAFSVAIIIALTLLEKWDWKKWSIVVFFTSIFIDIILYRSLGVTLLSISLSVLTLYTLFLVIPKKQILLSYIPYFLSVLLFYILLWVLSSFLEDGVFEVFSFQVFLNYLFKSLLSTILIFVVNILNSRFRTEKRISI
ncbi:TPA: hypothetical protein DEP90_00655 [Patescibacteria group bacterium]|nr:hypothetical protein [Patescibacteria group bacterium]